MYFKGALTKRKWKKDKKIRPMKQFNGSLHAEE